MNNNVCIEMRANIYVKTFKDINEYIQYDFNTKLLKGELSDSFTNYNNVGNTKVSVSINKKCL